MTIGKYDGFRLYLISCMDRYSVYSTYTADVSHSRSDYLVAHALKSHTSDY